MADTPGSGPDGAPPTDPGAPGAATAPGGFSTGPLPDDGVVALRRWRDTDVDQLAAACADAEIQRFLNVPSPYGRAEAEAYVARTRREWTAGTKVAFAVVDARDPVLLLGAVNLAVFGPSGHAGYWVAPGARRRGIATRALGLLAEWAFAELGLAIVVLEIRPDNEASVGVARAAGFREAGHFEIEDRNGTPTGAGLLFRRLRP